MSTERGFTPLDPRLTSGLFRSLHRYRPAWFGDDALAALALLVIAVPEQLATSRLAGMPPIAGFYAFVAGTTLFAVLGSNRRMSVGADSTIAPLFAMGIALLAQTGTTRYVDLVGVLALEVGVIVALAGVLRLGWIAEFMSVPIISGFLAGVAVIIMVHELPGLLGLAASGDTVQRLTVIAGHLGGANGWSAGIGLGVLTLVVVAQRIDRRVPGTLLGLIGSTVLVVGLHLQAHGVAVLGSFAHGLPRFGVAGISSSSVGSVLPLAGVVSLVVMSQSAATTRAFSDGGGYPVDVSRDFLGVGAGSVAAALVGAFPVNASPPRTAVVIAAGGRTQASGLMAAAALALLIPAAGLLQDVPVATLAAILLVVAARILPLRDLAAIARFDLFELGLAAVTFLTVALVGVEQGIGVAIGLAILDRTRLSARPQLHVLGRIPETTSWAPLSSARSAAQMPGVLVVLFATPLWYANAPHFRAELQAALGRAIGRPRLVVLDAVGMSDVDYTGCASLRDVLDELDRMHVRFAVARAGSSVRSGLARSGLLERIGADRFFASVDEAVVAMQARESANS